MTDLSQAPPEFDGILIGEQIRLRRIEAGLSLTALAEKAGVAKSYLSNLESGNANARPSGQTLYKIANALGTTMSDLLGTRLLVEPTRAVPDSLREFAESAHLSERDVEMLSGINFRGKQPSDPESWSFIWKVIRTSVDDT
jgi:XRE family transcriptional regulator, master regulator for biofilm formation